MPRPTIQSLEQDIYASLKAFYDSVMAHKEAVLRGIRSDALRLLPIIEEEEKDIKFVINKYLKLRRWDTVVDNVMFDDREGVVIKFFRPLPNGKTTYKRRIF